MRVSPDSAADVVIGAGVATQKVLLSWTNPNNSAITIYQYSTDGTNWTNIAGSGATTTSHEFTANLTSGAAYAYRVRGVAGQTNVTPTGLQAWTIIDDRAAFESRMVNTPTVATPARVTFNRNNWNSNQSVSVKLAMKPAETVTVAFAAKNAVFTPSTLTFTTQNWNTAQTAQVKLAEQPPADGAIVVVSGLSANPVAYSYTQTGLTNGTQYTFRARGINLRGKGTISDPRTATPAGPPAKPTDLTATASTTGAATVTLSWTAPSNTATAPIDKYQYRARNVPNNWLAWQDIPGSSKSTTTYAVTQTVTGSNLAYNELYGFQVRAVSVGGAGAVSDERQARPVFGVPPAPSLVSAAGGNAQAGLSWTSAMTRWIDKWQYQHSSDNGTTWTTWTDIPANSGKYRECRETAPNVVTCSDISTPEQGGTRFTRYALITGLENGKTYKLKVRSANAAGPGDASNAVTATTLPLAPATFTATGRDAEVALAWTKNAADATVTGWQYRQKAGTGKYGPWTPIIGSVSDSTVSHTVTELANDTAYTFQLRAVNATGAGAPSAERTANPQLSPPLKPAGFQAHAGDGLAMLQWDDPENASLTKWQYKQDGGSWEDICVTSSDSDCPRKTSHLVKGLTNGTEYTFKIRAVNDAGNGPDSDEKKATPLAVPGQPTDLAATGGDKQVSLVWKAPSGSVTGWQVRQASAGGSWGNWKTITPGNGANDTLTHTVTGLTNNVPYRFQVRATNASGGGTPSALASATPVSGVPTASTYLWAAGGDRSAALRWNKMAGHWVDSWEYRYKNGSGGYGPWTPVPGSRSGTVLYALTGLSNGKRYTFQVRPVNDHGAGGASPEAVAETLPLAPTSFTPMAGDQEVVLDWAKNANDQTAITRWEYRQKAGSEQYGNWIAIPGSGDATTSYTVTGLTNSVTYTFQLRAVNAAGIGPGSSQASASPAIHLPDKPTGLSAYAGDALVILSWDDPDNDRITRWEYLQVPGSGSWTQICQTSSDSDCPSQTTYKVTSLTNDTEYTFRLRAVTTAGNGPASDAVKATPKPVPGAPATLTTAPGGSGEVVLTWTAITGALEWQHRYKSANGYGSWAAIPCDLAMRPGNALATTYTVTELANNTLYTFQVRARNAHGWGLPAEATGRPVAGVPDTPTLSSAVGGNQQATLTWTTAGVIHVDKWQYTSRRRDKAGRTSPARIKTPAAGRQPA